MDKEKAKRIALIAFGVFTVIYMGYQVFTACVDKVKTEMAYETSVKNSLTVQGFVLRSEEYIKVSSSDTVVSMVEDGAKVTAGESVVRTFSSEAQAADYRTLCDVRSEIERYEKLSAVSPVSNMDTKGLNSTIDRAVGSLVSKIEDGALDETDDGFSSLRDTVIKKQLVVGKTVNFDSILSALRAQETALSKSVNQSGMVKANHSGYYVGSVDGYEEYVDYSQIPNVLPSEVDRLFQLKPQSVPKDCIGRLVTEFEWYIVCNVEKNSLEYLQKNKQVQLAFPNTPSEEINARVVALNTEGTDKVAVVLKCDQIDSSLVNMRNEEVEIIFDTYDGFRIPSNAVCELDGKQGVYILRSNTVSFRKINVLWSTDDYIITGGEGNQVKRYDQVIVKGKDLYDGKAVV
ncbi:MAG TPA: hypothetical protein DDY98_04725 [Ruminococcaceae bacterium]|nr:hypothetical protein [Oscillospiraceae bacterium]